MDEERIRYRGVSPELREVARSHRKEQTPAEIILWNVLRRGQLNGLRFRKQHPFETFILDFYCAEHRLIIEVDGGIHNVPDVAIHDRERDAYLTARGFRVVRIRNEEVVNTLPDVLARIAAAAQANEPQT